MSQTTKIVIGAAIVALVIGGIWFYLQSANTPAAPEQNTPNESQNNLTNNSSQNTPSDQNAPADTQPTAPATNNNATDNTDTNAATTATPASDTSDTAIDKDLSSVDSQVKGLSTDSASIDQGLNDQPIAQGE
jgi:hypothetical protein